jgi:hypothetical protein
VISDGLWRRRFGGDPAALGRRIQANNLDVQIVGILRPGFRVFLPQETLAEEEIGRGRSHLLAASMTDVPRAAEAFQAAIALDPDYAAGHAGLALACCAQAELRVRAPNQAYTDARTAALRALAMDDSSADAQVALGTVLFLTPL